MGMTEELGNLAMAAMELEAHPNQPPPPPLKPSVKRCYQLLNRRMKVGVLDGRFFVGKFHCLDKQGNLILYDTLECGETRAERDVAAGPPLSPSPSSSTIEQRSLGLVLIPARCRTSCLVEGSLSEQLTLLSLQEN